MLPSASSHDTSYLQAAVLACSRIASPMTIETHCSVVESRCSMNVQGLMDTYKASDVRQMGIRTFVAPLLNEQEVSSETGATISESGGWAF